MVFLFHTPHAWRGIRQRPHHLALRFAARGHQVRWIESRYLRWLVDQPRHFLRARAESPSPGFHVRPITLINGERLSAVRHFNQARLARALQGYAASDPPPRVLWLYNPHESHLADTVPHDLLVYDIMDEYQGFPWSPRSIAAEEAALLDRADLVFAGTGALYDAKRPLARGPVQCILSGVETERFARPAGPPDPALQTLRAHYSRLAGYAGMIDLRVDQHLLEAAAQALPHWGFVLLGPIVGDVRRLRRLPNVHLAGPRPYEELAACYQSWDAALLPFVENDLTRHINPTKMLEYGAAGVPIVARALPDVERFYADGAWLYRTTADFIAALGAIEANAPGRDLRVTAARGWAASRNWDAIAGQMLAAVEQALGQNSGRIPTSKG